MLLKQINYNNYTAIQKAKCNLSEILEIQGFLKTNRNY